MYIFEGGIFSSFFGIEIFLYLLVLSIQYVFLSIFMGIPELVSSSPSLVYSFLDEIE